MSSMRRLVSLLLKLPEMTDDSTVTGEKILERTNFVALEDALDHVSRTNDRSLKAALNLPWAT